MLSVASCTSHIRASLLALGILCSAAANSSAVADDFALTNCAPSGGASGLLTCEWKATPGKVDNQYLVAGVSPRLFAVCVRHGAVEIEMTPRTKEGHYPRTLGDGKCLIESTVSIRVRSTLKDNDNGKYLKDEDAISTGTVTVLP